MKATINGKRYNTETAILIGEADNIGSGAESVTDFQYWEAGLYRAPRSGVYFLAGRGGPMSRFSRSVGQSTWTSGSKIIPLTEGEAREWAERYLPNRVVEAHFAAEDA